MIRFGDRKSIPGLKKLWKECFADEDAYIDAFFNALYEDKNVLLEEENGVLMGASFFLPGEIYLERPYSQKDGEWRKIRYVYALAVFPQYRGQGIAGKLLRRAYEAYHAPLIAEPAEKGLVSGFYEPLGFTADFYLEKTWMKIPQYDVRAAGLPVNAEFVPVEAGEYCRIRDAYFQKHGYVKWPPEHAAFAIREHRGSGGGAYVFRRNGREDILLYYKEDQDMIVTETTFTEKEMIEIFLPWISGQCGRMVITTPPKQAGTVDKTVQDGLVTEQKCCLMGMSYGMHFGNGYLNLSLD